MKCVSCGAIGEVFDERYQLVPCPYCKGSGVVKTTEESKMLDYNLKLIERIEELFI